MAGDAAQLRRATDTPASSDGAANNVVFKGVDVVFQGRPVLQDLNLTIAQGEVVGFVGGSGVGKTTMLNLAAGLIEPSAGTVSVNGLPAAQRSRQSPPGYLFQQPTLLPWLRALDYVTLPLMVRNRPGAVFNPFNRPNDSERNAARAALARAKVEQAEQARPAQLSGGMQTRVALARTIVGQPTLMLLDEPFNSLDEKLRGEIYAEVQSIILEYGATTLLVTHNVLEAVLLSDRVVLLARPQPGLGAKAAFEIEVNLPRPRTLASIDDEAFLTATRKVREALFAL